MTEKKQNTNTDAGTKEFQEQLIKGLGVIAEQIKSSQHPGKGRAEITEKAVKKIVKTVCKAIAKMDIPQEYFSDKHNCRITHRALMNERIRSILSSAEECLIVEF